MDFLDIFGGKSFGELVVNYARSEFEKATKAIEGLEEILPASKLVGPEDAFKKTFDSDCIVVGEYFDFCGMSVRLKCMYGFSDGAEGVSVRPCIKKWRLE